MRRVGDLRGHLPAQVCVHSFQRAIVDDVEFSQKVLVPLRAGTEVIYVCGRTQYQ